jgi:C4-dicarboxylate-binding protein DctP
MVIAVLIMPLVFGGCAKAGEVAKEKEEYIEWTWNAIGPLSLNYEPGVWWCKEMEKRTNGHFKVNIVWGSTLGSVKENPSLVGAGAFEMGTYVAGYHSEFCLGHLMWAPFFGPDDLYQGAEFYDYYTYHPLFVEQLAKYNLYPILTLVTPGHVFPATMKFEKLEDFRGVPVACTGSLALWIQNMGGTPVGLTYGEFYEGFQRGMVKMGIIPMVGVQVTKMYEVAKYLPNQDIGSVGGGYICNKKAYDALPKYIKDVWAELREEMKQYAPKYIGEGQKKIADALREVGVQFYDIPGPEWARIKQAASPALESWVEYCKAQGYEKEAKTLFNDLIAKREKITGQRWTGYRP